MDHPKQLIMNRPYLLISPRGSGKTYELIRHAANHIKQCGKVAIFVTNSILAKNIKSKLANENISAAQTNDDVIITEDLTESVSLDTIRYFDEFDYLEFPEDFEIRPTDRFYGSAKKKRSFGANGNDPDDFLLKILNKTKGFYESRMWPQVFSYSGSEFLKDVSDESLNAEFLNNIWKI